MRRIRISLRGLILLVTAVGLFLGYAQYRRREILREAGRQSTAGYVFSIRLSWRDRVWQRPPIVGTISWMQGQEVLVRTRPGKASSTSNLYRVISEDPNEIERLKRLGMVEYAE